MSSTGTGRGGLDAYDLVRFLVAQEETFDAACRELEAGLKQSHWMWFVFPQMRGLGRSAMATRYAIASLDEARAYLAHPILGPRLRHVAELLLSICPRRSAREIMGSPDDLKLRSSMTLFSRAGDSDAALFRAVLERYFADEEDRATLRLIGVDAPPPFDGA